jgi:Tfp pilus assembly protein PilF
MSRTLNLVDRLLARGRKLHRLGATHDALGIFSRLIALPDLPPAVARLVQVYLARTHLRGRRYARARRHLAALLVHLPNCATCHYLMARAVAADRRCEAGRALEHCRRAVRLAPRHAGYLSTFGLLAVRQGREEEGLDALRRAAELAPDSPRVLRRLARGLSLLDRGEEARSVLLAARFRNGRDARFQRLWDDFRFEQLHLQQRQARRRAAEVDGGPNVLPFLRPVPAQAAAEAPPAARVDGPTLLPAPHQPRLLRRPDQRHAQ